MNNTIPVITLYQPWATFIMLGWKTIETRTHDRFKGLVGKTIGIHAGNTFDKSKAWHNWLSSEQKEIFNDTVFRTGAFLGTVKVDFFDELAKHNSEEALIDCDAVFRYGLFLSNPKPIMPVNIKGSMGIWYYDLDKEEKVTKAKPIEANLLF